MIPQLLQSYCAKRSKVQSDKRSTMRFHGLSMQQIFDELVLYIYVYVLKSQICGPKKSIFALDKGDAIYSFVFHLCWRNDF